MNFLEETIEAITKSGHQIRDVMFIGSLDGKYRLTWEQFKELAKDLEYDSSFGAQHIATDLIIYFYDTSYITRGEYDGAEWWEYNKQLIYTIIDDHETITNLGNDKCMWNTVEELNKSN